MAVFNLNNEYEREQYKEYCDKLFRQGGVIEVKKRHSFRTLAQNSYLHLLLSYFASEFGYTLEEVKYNIFKKEINPNLFTRKRKNKRGEEVCYLCSSRELDTAEMTTAIERFRNYSAAKCGLYLPAPHEADALVEAQRQVDRFEEYL